MKPEPLFLLLPVLLLSVLKVEAQNPDTLDVKSAFAREPVPSMASSPSDTLARDTISTENPAIKVLLYSDFTWKYVKDPEYVMSQDIFTECWSDEYPNPFREPQDSLPAEVALWIVDSLSQYHCPNQVKVFSPFGLRHGRRHTGVDLPLHMGDPVYAAFDGKVRFSKYYAAYGNLVIVRHENGLETFYAHLSKRNVEVGDWVNAGDIIGQGGSTGRSTGPHLHFETRYRGYAFDPQWLIDFESGTLRHRVFVLKRKYLTERTRYVPESIDEEDDILTGDERDAEEAAKKAAAEKAAAEALANAQYHTIKSGDTLSGIAVKYHTTVNKLCQLNGISTRTVLQIGKKLRVK